MTWHLAADFFVKGVPKPQPRARTLKTGHTYTPPNADGWKERIIWTAGQHVPGSPIDGPVKVPQVYLLPRPKRLCRKKDPDGLILHDKRPDRDNLEKCMLDMLKYLGFFKDDGQVCGGEVEKFYHRKNGAPGASIVIYEWKEDVE